MTQQGAAPSSDRQQLRFVHQLPVPLPVLRAVDWSHPHLPGTPAKIQRSSAHSL
jgi:hypothetical protein